MSFQANHISLLLRYSGISGVAGAVNHGFFSEERSLITAAIGIVLYLVGAFLDHRNHPGAGRSGHPEAEVTQT